MNSGIASVDLQRTKLFRAQAIVRTVARLFHETYLCAPKEPDLGYALDAVDEMIEGVIAALDPSAQRAS